MQAATVDWYVIRILTSVSPLEQELALYWITAHVFISLELLRCYAGHRVIEVSPGLAPSRNYNDSVRQLYAHLLPFNGRS